MPQVDRMFRSVISTLTLSLSLGLSLPMASDAGGFRTGTYQTKDHSSSNRSITSGMEEIRSERSYSNSLSGSSQVEHLGMTIAGDGFQWSRQGQQLIESSGSNELNQGLSAAGLSQSELMNWSSSATASSSSSVDHDLKLKLPGIGLQSLLSDQGLQAIDSTAAGRQSLSGGAISLQSSDVGSSSSLESLNDGLQLSLNGSLDIRMERGGQNGAYTMEESGRQHLHSLERFTGSSVFSSERTGRGDLFAFD
ncbi:hypothetical protein CWE16_04365 [Synechococcus sp. BS55D]|nr:hypothetical protein CWE16_04365 [Synechococcus sp. BS55D]